MSMLLRPATLKDVPIIVEYNRLLAEESEHKKLNVAVLTRGVENLLRDSSRGIYFVAEVEGNVIGQLMITFEWSDWRDGWMWWLQSVYVRPENRRQGVFRALCEHVFKHALERGDVVGIRLYVERENYRAHATYQHLGLREAGYFVMEKALREPLF